MSDTQRIDKLLVQRGLVDSRSRAKARIMAGDAFVDDQRVDKAGTQIDVGADIELRGDDMPYVSRGGLKLEAGLKRFDVDPEDRVAIDVGASTGGFTDCLLQRGTKKVYAVDVGYGQLAWKLRNDDRVVVFERTNIRHLDDDAIDEPCSLATIDTSFISLRIVLPNTLRFLTHDADIIALIKPQFEAGKDRVGKGGVVGDDEVRRQVIDEVIDAASEMGLEYVDGVDSPVHGPAGNIEHVAHFRRSNRQRSDGQRSEVGGQKSEKQDD